MKTKHIWFGVAFIVAWWLLGNALWISTQQPHFWFDGQGAGMSLTKGGYRSWKLQFCDGQTWIDGKLEPVVITTNGLRKGYYRWPIYQHIDLTTLFDPKTGEFLLKRASKNDIQ